MLDVCVQRLEYRKSGLLSIVFLCITVVSVLSCSLHQVNPDVQSASPSPDADQEQAWDQDQDQGQDQDQTNHQPYEVINPMNRFKKKLQKAKNKLKIMFLNIL